MDGAGGDADALPRELFADRRLAVPLLFELPDARTHPFREDDPAASDAEEEGGAAGSEPSDAEGEDSTSTEQHGSWEQDTQDLGEISGVRGSTHRDGETGPVPSEPDAPSDIDSAEEAQRAARAALQRWTSSASE